MADHRADVLERAVLRRGAGHYPKERAEKEFVRRVDDAAGFSKHGTVFGRVVRAAVFGHTRIAAAGGSPRGGWQGQRNEFRAG